MKMYSEAKIELISLSVADVITASGGGEYSGWGEGENVTEPN